MKQTVANTSDDGLTLDEFDFILARMGDNDIVFRLVAVRRWQRQDADELTPWPGPPLEWRSVDLFGKNTLKEPPEVPESALSEARQFILSRIIFELQ